MQNYALHTAAAQLKSFYYGEKVTKIMLRLLQGKDVSFTIKINLGFYSNNHHWKVPSRGLGFLESAGFVQEVFVLIPRKVILHVGLLSSMCEQF